MDAAPLVLLFLACAATTQPAAAAPPKTCDGSFQNPKAIRFHFGGNYPPFDYFKDTPEPYTRVGFGVEFARILCARFELECEFVRASYDDCWPDTDYPGKGITDGSFDACSTYTDTFLRRTGVSFSHSYTMRQAAGILSRLDEEGNPVVGPRMSDLSGYKIGFIGGWATDVGSFRLVRNNCTGERFTGYEEVVPKDKYFGPDAAMRALVQGKVDALFGFASLIDNRKGCESKECDQELYVHLGKKYAWVHTGMTEYQGNGTTLAFTPKGSILNAFLNPMIDEVLQSREYAELCYKYSGEDIHCYRNNFTSGIKTFPTGSLPDTARTALCLVREDPEACNACASGYCGCEVPGKKPPSDDKDEEEDKDPIDSVPEEEDIEREEEGRMPEGRMPEGRMP